MNTDKLVDIATALGIGAFVGDAAFVLAGGYILAVLFGTPRAPVSSATQERERAWAFDRTAART
ncbi:MAG: hypothetical protein ACJ789_20445 [Thermomicrobiales bacterium]